MDHTPHQPAVVIIELVNRPPHFSLTIVLSASRPPQKTKPISRAPIKKHYNIYITYLHPQIHRCILVRVYPSSPASQHCGRKQHDRSHHQCHAHRCCVGREELSTSVGTPGARNDRARQLGHVGRLALHRVRGVA